MFLNKQKLFCQNDQQLMKLWNKKNIFCALIDLSKSFDTVGASSKAFSKRNERENFFDSEVLPDIRYKFVQIHQTKSITQDIKCGFLQDQFRDYFASKICQKFQEKWFFLQVILVYMV